MKNCIQFNAGSWWYVRLVLGLMVIFGAAFQAESQTIRYVKQNGTGNGSSWNNASGDLQAMINESQLNEQVWVAAGTYYSAGEGFTMKNGVGIYGGFPSSGTPAMNERNWKSHTTILSGQAVRRVIYNNFTSTSPLTNSAILNGFTIKLGKSIGLDGVDEGALATNAYGGGIYNYYASPTIVNCIITQNRAQGGKGPNSYANGIGPFAGHGGSASGAGMYNYYSSPIISNCIFSSNTAQGGKGGPASHLAGNGGAAEGGGIHNHSSSPLIDNCLFTSNSCIGGDGGEALILDKNQPWKGNGGAAGGGAIFNFDCQAIFINCTITSNLTHGGLEGVSRHVDAHSGKPGIGSGGGIHNEGANAKSKIYNSIVFANTASDAGPNIQNNNAAISTIVHSLIQSSGGSGVRWSGATGEDGGHNIDVDPLFKDPANSDYRLSTWSPAVNMGGNTLLPNAETLKDLAGNPRVYSGNIDMGAYENQEIQDASIRYVRQGATGNGYSWADAAGDLQAMINSSAAGNEVWVAAGEYQPASGQSFSMKEGVEIYGGFPSTGNPAIADRNYATYVTTLKGNGSSVVYNNYNLLTNTTILDGFTITGGSAGEGGGIYNRASSPLMRNLVIKGNTASSAGGGVAISGGGDNFRLENTLIVDNTASGQGGGIYVLTSSSPTLLNVTISGNTAGAGGSGVTVERSYLHTQNSIVWGNTGTALNFKGPAAGSGGAAAISYSLIQGSGGSGSGWSGAVGNDGGHNIDVDPLFKDPANGNYSLPTWSPAVNMGGNTLLPNVVALKDLSGNPRVYGSSVDIGAYENQQVQNASIRYVRQGGTGNGYSWGDAAGGLQTMINSSAAGNQVWVAAGEYQPASGQSFTMKEGVKIYGGFPATGNPTITDRNYASNATTLKGNNASVVSNNFNELTHAAVLDGFTITGGSANKGGGIHNRITSPLMRNLVIKNNTANSGGGIAIMESSNTFRLENTLITDNTASEGGGVIAVNSSSPALVNVTVTGNNAGSGSGVKVDRSNLGVYNSIVWGNSGTSTNNFQGPGMNGKAHLTHSLIQGSGGGGSNWNEAVGTDHGNNIDADPAFVDPTNGDFSIRPWSPAVNAGHASFFTDASWALDLSYRARSYGTGIDMGAYENQQIQDASIRYVRQGGAGGGYSWADAAGDLQAIINFSASGNEVWVAAGEYQPASGQSFSMKEGVKIYGGFPSTGNPGMADRDYAAHVTSLKGNGNSVIANVNNGLTHAALLDGFTIKGGAAGSNNDGGGIRNWYASPSLFNLKIKGNSARTGGGIDNGHANILLVNSEISGNTAHNVGSGVSNYASHSATYVNVTIAGNTGPAGSGAVFNESARPVFVNSIVYGNTDNAGMVNDGGGSANITYSLIQGQPADVSLHNLDGTKSHSNLFVDAATANYSLTPGSEANDKGDNTAFPTDLNISRDLSGNRRLAGTTIDLGAYENQVKIQTRYVRQGGSGNGHTWATASGDLQAMINESYSGNEVWVATGEYQPAVGQSFSMKEGVKIYGGFSATGTPEFTDRNWNQHTTTLKGNGKSVVVNDNNGLTNSARLDGFTITGGLAVTGGGMLNHLAYPLINHCVFKANHATVWGGGIYNDGPGMTTVVNSLIYQNTAQSGAGAFSYQNAKPRFTSVTMTGNTAEQNGGALHNYEGAETELVNTIVWGNSQGAGSSQLYTGGEGKTKAYFSVLEGGAAAIIGGQEMVDIVSGNPLFTDAANGNFTLQGCSPALNLGTGGVLQGFTTDLAGNSRFKGIVDAGAYEYQAAPLTGADRLAVNGHTTSVDIAAGQTYVIQAADDACRSVAVITSNGISPVSGMVYVTTHIGSAVQAYNGSPYVQRHYDISPVSNASAATARITLYFTQSELTAYNTSLGRNVLPASPDGDRSNIRVFQYHGTPKAGQSGPGAYTGTPTSIAPDLNWNAALERWELSFDVKGFSGFFVGAADAALPVKLVSFEGREGESNTVALQWKVTEQVNMVEYTVERGVNARDFSAIGSVVGNGDNESRYRFTDAHSLPVAVVYYRLKMLEADGSFSYSKVISVKLSESDLIVYPIPARNFVRVKGRGIAGTSLMVVNAQGMVLKAVEALADSQEMDVSMLPAGVYFIQTALGHGLKMIKE